MSKLDDLEAKARAATAGPWVEDDGNVFSAPISNADYEARSRARRDGLPHADAAFIAAANPATVLAMVEVIRSAVADIEELRSELSATEAKLAEAQLENRTAIALLKWARIGDRTVFLNSRGSFVASGDEEVNGRTARSLRGLAQKLGLVEKAGG